MVPLLVSQAQTAQLMQSGYRPADGCVPDAITAVKIAEAVLIPVYGKKQIASESLLKPSWKGMFGM